MGLFSFLRKNKQDVSADDGGYVSRSDDESASARARSKRASNAGASPAKRGRDAADPILPEKKRARRRLVGAIALALAVAVGLPMLLDSEPKPLSSDIAIQIPSKDKVAPLALPAAVKPDTVAASAALDQREEIVTPPAPPKTVAAPEPKLNADPKPARETVKPDANSVAKVELKAQEHKPVERKPVEHKPAEAKPAEPRVVDSKPAEPRTVEARPKPVLKTDDKPVEHDDDSARALAILEGKATAHADGPAHAEAAPVKYVLQVAALATQDKVNELQGKLKEAGIKSYTQKVPTESGERIRIRVGPFANKEEAEKARAKLGKIGLSGSVVPAG